MRAGRATSPATLTEWPELVVHSLVRRRELLD